MAKVTKSKARRRFSRAAQHRKVVRDARRHYDALLELQGGVCAICGKPPSPTRRHCIDHDHKTMKVRGILCTHCNRMLHGRLTRAWLLAAYDYLKDPPMRRLG